MQTLERTESAPVVDEQIHTLKNRNRTLVFLSAILAVAVLVMGAIMIFGDDGGDGGDGGQSLTPEQEQMLETIDQFDAALNAGDGAAAVALMAPSGWHQVGVEGKQYLVADGSLEAHFDGIDRLGFSARRADASFIGTYVVTTSHIPADSEDVLPGIFRMNFDGTMIMWHLGM